jgi:putative flippase GtrA
MREGISGKARRAGLLLRRLFTSDSGILGQLVRFTLVGGLASLIYLLTTTLLALVVGIPFQVALTIGFLLSMVFNFAMQRMFVWANRDGFSLPFHHQAGRFLSLAAVQYGVTTAITSLLPSALGLPTEVVYVATVALLAVVNFLIYRHGVFHVKVQITHSEGEPCESLAGVAEGASKISG